MTCVSTFFSDIGIEQSQGCMDSRPLSVGAREDEMRVDTIIPGW